MEWEEISKLVCFQFFKKKKTTFIFENHFAFKFSYNQRKYNISL